MGKFKTKISIFVLLFFVAVACKKKNSSSIVPNIPVEVTINLTLPSYSALSNVGGWAYLSGGSRGIVVYRRSVDEFVAFDRYSSATPDDKDCSTPLTVSTTNSLQLDDDCSSAVFSLYDGSAISGSDYGLRQYQTFFDGSSSLRVYN
jgi:hypothetical protein